MSAPFVKTKQELTCKELYTLGKWCEKGRRKMGVLRDANQAMSFYKQSAKLASTDSKYGAYVASEDEFGNLMMALTNEKNREKACGGGVTQEYTAEDFYIVGLAFEKGYNGVVDIAKAISCYKRSAELSILERKKNAAEAAKAHEESEAFVDLMLYLEDKINSKDRKDVEMIKSSNVTREDRKMVDVAASFLVDGAADEYLKSKEPEAALQKKPPHLAVKSSMGSPNIAQYSYKGDSTGSPEGSRLHMDSAFIKGDEEIFNDSFALDHTNFSSKPNLVLEEFGATQIDSRVSLLDKVRIT